MQRLLISGGGTGGGTYPAIAVAAAVQHRLPDCAILWMGTPNGIERGLVERAGLDFTAVPSGPLVGVGLRAGPSALKIAVGTLAALVTIARFRPDALLMTGGWPVLPATLACRILGVPIAIYLPDLEPGGTIRITSRFARVVATNFDQSAEYFPEGKTVTCGYPLRADVLRAAGFNASGQPLPDPPASKARAAERFGLADGAPVVLVFGGSKGTSTINEAVLNHLSPLVEHAHLIHITGREHWEQVQARAASSAATQLSGTIRVGEEKQFGRTTVDLNAAIANRYHPFDYLHSDDMALALAAADLAVSRAGAATLGEYPLFGLPAVLVPLERAWRYQRINAEFLADRGAAVILPDGDLVEELGPLVSDLLAGADRLAAMAHAAESLRRPDAASRVVDVLVDLTSQT
ncbi:MAG: glycosyltransferase [Anaerolineae bacterium]